MHHGHVTGIKRHRRMRRATAEQYAERAAALAQILRDKTLDELLALTPQRAAQALRQHRNAAGTPSLTPETRR